MKSPIDEIGFLSFTIAFAPDEEIVKAVKDQLSLWWKNGFTETKKKEDFAPLRLRKEYNPNPKQITLYSVSSTRSGVLIDSNLNDGYLSLTHIVSAALPDVQFIRIRSKSVEYDNYPIQEFAILKGGRQGYVRHVWVALDSNGWKFGNTGIVQPFEEPVQYRKRAIKDRLTQGMIVRYLEHIGMNLDSIAKGSSAKLLAHYEETQQW